METERICVMRGVPLISRSMGKVTTRSISSAARPGICVMT